MNETRPEDDGGPLKRRIALRLMYDGSAFCGWQRQLNGRTVQGELERILSRLAGDRPVTVVGAGRTDSGVHAHGQVAHADLATRYDDAWLLHAVRRMCPDDLAVTALTTAPESFHARFRANRRSYRYTIIFSPDPFRARYAWRYDLPLDRELLDAAARRLLGTHDFTALSKFNPDTEDPICTVTHAAWSDVDGGIVFDISADRFLYGMVRLLIGLQVDVARRKREVGEIDLLLDRPIRAGQSPSAPAHGLSLVGVGYPDPPFGTGREPDR
jgi:tRNA pseudouridine38-40 synthase